MKTEDAIREISNMMFNVNGKSGSGRDRMEALLMAKRALLDTEEQYDVCDILYNLFTGDKEKDEALTQAIKCVRIVNKLNEIIDLLRISERVKNFESRISSVEYQE